MARKNVYIMTKKGKREVNAEIMWFNVGNNKVWFTVHSSGANDAILSHYKSGYRVCSLGAHILSRFVADGYTKLTWREAAEEMLNKIINQYGVDAIIQKFNSVPEIN